MEKRQWIPVFIIDSVNYISALLLKNCHNKEKTNNVFKSVNSVSIAKALIQLSWDSALLLKNSHSVQYPLEGCNKEKTNNVFKSVNSVSIAKALIQLSWISTFPGRACRIFSLFHQG